VLTVSLSNRAPHRSDGRATEGGAMGKQMVKPLVLRLLFPSLPFPAYYPVVTTSLTPTMAESTVGQPPNKAHVTQGKASVSHVTERKREIRFEPVERRGCQAKLQTYC